MPELPHGATIVVLAKAPVPGRVKTRLMTEFSGAQAAALARAALLDTLDAAAGVVGARVVLALDGDGGDWLPPGVSTVPQRGRGLDERIAAALADAYDGTPLLLVGMDTPQVDAARLRSALRGLARADAVLGLAEDGGWWALGVHRPDDALVHGVPMSTADTGRLQRQRLLRAGLRLRELAVLRDVDTPDDAHAVALLAPDTRFARLLREFTAAAACAPHRDAAIPA